jgi:hypothetical protein
MKILILGFIIAQVIYFLYANYNFVDEFAYYGFTNKEDYENYKNSMTELLNQPADENALNVIDKINKLNPPNLEIYNMMNHEPYFKLNTGIVRIIAGVSFWLAVFTILFLFCDYLHRKLYG